MTGAGYGDREWEGLAGQKRLLSLVVTGCLLALVSAVPASGATVRTVLLVHGYQGSTSSFDQMEASLQALGIPSVEVALPGENNVANAVYIQGIVKGIVQAGGPGTSVEIVAHSMGGLSSRWYAKFLGGSPAGGTPLVAHYVSLGTPQYGLWAACVLLQTNGGQMCPTSSFLGQLNGGDDTTGSAAYTTIYSTNDGLVPTSSSRLDGGACFVQDSGVTHDGLLTNVTVFDQIVAALRSTCPGVFKTT